MLEKLDSQNVAACENQGEQCELSNHRKSIRTFLKKHNREWHKKPEKTDWNASFNKRVYILQYQI